MSEERGSMGKLVLLRRIREEREREALAGAARAEERARSREEAAEDRRSAAAAELARASQESGGDPPQVEVLQFRSRFMRRLQALAVQVEVEVAAMRGERIDAAEAAARIRASLAQTRRARECLEERLAAARRERGRARERAEAGARDDAPGPPDSEGGPGSRGP